MSVHETWNNRRSTPVCGTLVGTTETAPESAVTLIGGLTTLTGLESKMAGAQSIYNPPPALDACPECGQRNCRAYMLEPGVHAYVASYDCECCGHHWTTTWAHEGGVDRG